MQCIIKPLGINIDSHQLGHRLEVTRSLDQSDKDVRRAAGRAVVRPHGCQFPTERLCLSLEGANVDESQCLIS